MLIAGNRFIIICSFPIYPVFCLSLRYTDKISEDGSFILEIRQLIRHSSAKIIHALFEADLNEIINDDVMPVLVTHIQRICHISKEFMADNIAHDHMVYYISI
jgi:hypothetical protein